MNILRRHEGAKLLFMEYAGKDVYMQNYYAHAAYHGIRNTSIVQAAQTPWIDHLYVKTSVDLVLVTNIVHISIHTYILIYIHTSQFFQPSLNQYPDGSSLIKVYIHT